MLAIQIFDMGLTLRGEIAAPVSLRLRRRFRAVGDFEMTLPACHPMADRIGIDTLLVPAGAWHKAMLVEAVTLAQGKETLCVSGYTLSGLLRRRVCVPPDGGEGTYGYDRVRADAESVMRHYVMGNVVAPQSAARRMDCVALEAENGHRGMADVPWSARFEPLDELLGDVAAYCDAGFDLAPDSARGKLVFRFLPGRDRTGADGLRSVTFAAGMGNVEATTQSEDARQAKNAAIAAGAGEDEMRLILSVCPEGETGVARRETFVDAGSLSDAQELTQEAAHRLADRKIARSIRADVRDTPSCRYGETWELGDLVNVQAGSMAMRARITEVQETHEAGRARQIAVTFGDPVGQTEKILRQRTRSGVR